MGNFKVGHLFLLSIVFFSPMPPHQATVITPGQRCITVMGKKGWGKRKEVCGRLGASSARSLMASGATTWRTG